MKSNLRTKTAISLLVSDLEGKAPGEIRLLPAGVFRALDGRPEGLPGWKLTMEDMERIVREAAGRVNDYVIDYEHQTIQSRNNGQPAPAAGWFHDLQAREDGIWAVDVRWTERAKKMIEAGEYRYISPVFEYDKKSGRILKLLMATITNNPALDGLIDLMPMSQIWEESMEKQIDERLKILVDHLKLQENEDVVEAALNYIKKLESEIQTREAKSIPIEEHAALQAEVNKLRAEIESMERSRLLEAGLADGRILPAQKEYWSKQSLASLKSWLEVAQPVAALTEMQSAKLSTAAEKGDTLSDSDREAMRLLGMSEETFLNAKKRMQKKE